MGFAIGCLSQLWSSSARMTSSSTSTVVTFIVGMIVLYLGHSLYHGISIRIRFRQLQARGLVSVRFRINLCHSSETTHGCWLTEQPVPQPYSVLFGHLRLMSILRKGLPSDAHDTYVLRRLALEWQDYFSTAAKCPPVVYLDLWPFLSEPLILVISSQACAQLTQENPQPRHSLFQWALTPLTSGKDLTSVDMPTHRIWRSRLNPGFSSKSMMSQVDALIEEVTIFVKNLKDKAGKKSTWGEKFTLYDITVSLTFDVILRTTLWVVSLTK